MKMKHVSTLAAVLVASLGASSAHAIQKHDPIFQTHATSGVIDPDLVREVRFQNGSPRSRPDLYVQVRALGIEPNLVREVRFQSGTPRSNNDQRFMITPLK
jgi:hypothetical protein